MAITNNLYVIAAICGNFYQESTVNPGIWEGLIVGNPGYGLGQWTDNPPIVERRTALFNWLDANGYSRDSGEGQLQFLMYENLWIANNAYGQSAYNSLWQYIASSSTNLYDLTQEFMFHWEGINDGSFNIRYTWAQNFLDLFQNDNGVRNPWVTGNFYCSINEAKSNALLIKDFFTGSTPPEPPEPPTPYEPTEEEIAALFSKLLKERGVKGVHIII